MPTICHFEIPTGDPERTTKFYSSLFDWKIDKWGEDPKMEYWMINTTDVNGKKGLGGGIMRRSGSEQRTVNYFDVSSVDDYLRKVERMGGKITTPKSPVPGMGYFAVCEDPEKNVFGLFEYDALAK